MSDLQSSYQSGGGRRNSRNLEQLAQHYKHSDYKVILGAIDKETDYMTLKHPGNFILQLEKTLKRCFFEINHVLLAHQAILPIIYHAILLFEFIQLLFFIFYKVEVLNEFSYPQYYDEMVKLQNSTKSLSNSLSNDAIANGTTVATNKWYSSFRIDYYFTFTNFQMYILQQQSKETFMMLYIVITVSFLVYVIAIITFSKQIFKDERNDSLKDGMKYLVKFFSILMTVFLFILQIPMITIYLQGYLCDEDSTFPYTLIGVKCFSLTHQLYITFSTISLIVYIVFLIIQSLLFTSNSFESSLPWSSLERRLSIMRILLKFILTCCFVFDKQGKLRGPVDLVCFMLSLFVVYHRYKKALIFKQSVYYAMIIYEVQMMWLFLCISIHILSDQKLNLVSLGLMILSGFFFGVILIIMTKRKTDLMMSKDISQFKHIDDVEIYLYRIYQLINSQAKNDHYILHGVLCNHMYNCNNEKCPCINIMEIQDNVKVNHGDEKGEHTQLNINSMGNQGTLVNEASLDKIANLGVRRKIKDIDAPTNRTLNNIGITGSGATQRTLGTQNRLTINGISMNARTRRNIKLPGSIGWQDKKPQEKVLSERKKKRQEIQWYRFLGILIDYATEKFPKTLELKIINSLIQNKKVKNEFKAVFELMNCELCHPNFQDQFVIFRRKIQIELIMKKNHQKNVSEIGKIDVQQVYRYERYFQQYTLLEYKTAFAALQFWRELLQKNVNSNTLQERGAEISKNYEIIQEIAGKLIKIYPFEIKFYFRYGTFLYQIINNAFDALTYFEKIYYTYHGRQTKKAQTINELTLFGENSNCAIIMISANSRKVGNVIHVNDEVETILGFKKQEILQKNISIICPKPIANIHDKFVHRYFDTAQPTVIDIKRQLFACSNNGYLKAVRLLVKVYPHISNRIVFVGFMQHLDKFEDMQQAKHEYQHYEYQYIMTDKEHNITNVTEGLNIELGLNSKFFLYSDSIFEILFNFGKICPEVVQEDIQDILEEEGLILNIDTRNMLDHIGLESLSSDEILEIRSKLGRYECYVQVKTLVLDKNFCTVKLYRICIIQKVNESTMFNTMIKAMVSKYDEDPYEQGQNSLIQGTNTVELEDYINQPSQLSLSSTTSGSYGFNKIIKDFKKALGERKTPRNLIYLNRLMMMFLTLNIILSGVDFGLKQSNLNNYESNNTQMLYIQTRVLDYIQIVSNFRSLINVINGIEFDTYDVNLSSSNAFSTSNRTLDRIKFLKQTILINQEKLQKTHEFITQQRISRDSELDISNLIKKKEYEEVNLNRIQNNYNISTYQLEYRVALNLYLNYLQQIISFNTTQMKIPNELLKALPKTTITNASSKLNLTSLTEDQKIIYFLLSNGLRELRQYTYDLVDFYHSNTSIDKGGTQAMTLMIIGIFTCLVSYIVIIYQIVIIERNKISILSLYALLQIDEIQEVHSKCDQFLEYLPFNHIKPKFDIYPSVIISSSQLANLSRSPKGGGFTTYNNFHQRQESMVSEEEKEAEIYKMFVMKKRAMSRTRNKQRVNSLLKEMTAGEEKQKQIIRKTLEQVKEIQDLEQQQYQIQIEKRQKAMKNRGQSKRRPSIKNLSSNIVIINNNKSQPGQLKKTQQPPQKHHHHHKENHKNVDSHKNDHSDSSENEEPIKNVEIVVEMKDQQTFSAMDLQDRTKSFQRQINNVGYFKQLRSLWLGVCFIAYFLYIYTFQIYYQDLMSTMLSSIPIFFNRYSNLMLSYNFLREQMVNLYLNPNQSLGANSSYLGYERPMIEDYFHSLSMSDQNKINDLKVKYPVVLEKMIDLVKIHDSPEFCNSSKTYTTSDQYIQDSGLDGTRLQIDDYCERFSDGLLSKGIQQVIGTFNKKFTDQQILIQTLSTQNNSKAISDQMRAILKTKINLNDQVLQQYFQVQELYFYKIIEQMTQIWLEAFKERKVQLVTIIQVVFFIFLALLLFILVFIRGKMIDSMKDKVFLSRGILNLIPENFFEKNKESVENLIKKLKN